MPLYGLIGYPLDHSWSKKYFDTKFASPEFQSCEYRLFSLEQIDRMPKLVGSLHDLQGLNVTAPYKTAVMSYLNDMDEVAMAIGAVNTITIKRSGPSFHLTGYNTDAYGFMESIRHLLTPVCKNALILGTGGAARAVKYIFDRMEITCRMVARTPRGDDQLGYHQVDSNTIHHAQIIVNATPVGLFPHIDECPDIPFHAIHSGHLVIDMIYNPPKTLFLQKAEDQGATILNGWDMLIQQAEKSWDLWNPFRQSPPADRY